MFFGLTIEKLILIGVIAALLIGPERLPAAAESLRRAIVHVRGFARTAQERVREELGPEMTEVDWQRLDPRRYDPRRIVREALLSDLGAAPLAPPPAVLTPARGTPAGAPDAPAGAPDTRAEAPDARAEAPGASGDQADAVPGSGSRASPDVRADTVRSAESTRRTAA